MARIVLEPADQLLLNEMREMRKEVETQGKTINQIHISIAKVEGSSNLIDNEMEHVKESVDNNSKCLSTYTKKINRNASMIIGLIFVVGILIAKNPESIVKFFKLII